MTDPIADMLTRIRNGAAVGKREVVLPMSKIKHEIAKILEKEKWIKSVEVVDPGDSKLLEKKEKLSSDPASSGRRKSDNFKQLKIVLRYKKSGKPAISHLKRVSRPGLRLYVGKSELPIVLNDLGMAIISTPQGLMTNKEARKEKVGGEIICEVY